MRNEQSIHNVVTNLKARISGVLHPEHITHKDALSHKRVLTTLGLSTIAALAAACNPQPPALPTDSSHNPIPTPTAFVSPTLSPTETQQPTQQPLPTVTYDSVTNTVQLTPTATQEVTATQETATPTELGTLAKVKFGKTEITAGLDITFMVNLYGTMTPVRLVASHDIAGIQADTWYTQTINGQTPQELLRKNIEDMLNARPTKDVWELTNGNGLKGTFFPRKPDTKIVLIDGTQQNIRDSAVPWDPVANNFKFAAEYDPKANELRMMTAGQAEYNIPLYLKQYPKYHDQYPNYENPMVFGEIYSDFAGMMMVYSSVTDAFVMNPDSHQLNISNTLLRTIGWEKGIFKTVEQK